MKKYRFIFYIVMLTGLVILGIWTFYNPDELAGMKKIEEVESGTEEPVAVVKAAVEAVQKGDRKALARQMFSQDQLEVGIITEPLWKEPFAPVEIIGCSRRAQSNGNDIMVHVYSVPRKKSYCFTLIKDSKGKFKIQAVGSSSRMPENKEEKK